MTQRPELALRMVLSLVALAVSTTAFAISPATSEQMLCGSNPYVFVGRVLSAVNKHCHLTKPKAQCPTYSGNEVQLEVQVIRILGVRPEVAKDPQYALREGQTIKPMTTARAAPFAMSKDDGQGRLAFNAPYDTILPDEWLRAAYVGQEFVFAGGPTHVRVWALDKLPWAQETMVNFSRLGAGRCHIPL
jgi:hypothetical protein